MKGRLLLVDDESMKRRALCLEARQRGYEAEEAGNAKVGLELIRESYFDVVITDVRMPGMDGHEFQRVLRATVPDTSVIIMTAYGTVASAVQAMRDGAQDYLLKPFSADELFVRLDSVMRFRQAMALNRAILGGREDAAFHRMLGRSTAMRDVYSRVARVAPLPSTVLVTGESGTGKELIAEALHELSPRAEKELVKVSCAALPADVLESELFGHTRGAFTGAVRDRRGRFELADGGTLFLDDVDDIPLPVQVKLLRVLQNRVIERVGSERSQTIDVRVIACTKVALEDLVADGRFRQDLFFRLNVVRIDLPPLRRRLGDVPLLARHFLQRFADASGRSLRGMEEQALAALCTYDWPGNVRELENTLEGAVALATGDMLTVADLPEGVRASAPVAGLPLFVLEGRDRIDLREELDKAEAHMLRWALARSDGRQRRAAALLSIPRTTLRDRLIRLDLIEPTADENPSTPDE